MAKFNTEKWDEFWDGWDVVIQKFPDAKRMALNEMGRAVLKEVLSQIKKQGITDQRGRVGSWQEIRIGSGGGYVAVSPDHEEVQVTKQGEKTNAKDVTRYLDRGHKVRGPSGRAKRYRPRMNYENSGSVISASTGALIVKGRLFYSYARENAERIAMHAAERNVLVHLENMLYDLYGDSLYEGTRYEDGG